ncbi:Armadillo-type fold [Kalmanozyma brasiliensis GHG001]|uniref:Armadillo-type fold n=1 Tax=Kalmanozyma brasiliensis (strain GHG001) TaxID=1365824 RepID=UPI002867C622|nr:Armadillo-type fold [Kalmanozyma brasiliensis GHG001]EST05980.2 Armadillo-type fold [Kalmanozyma brasiliensis GHG001]
MSLVTASPHLQEALASIHQASAEFTNPDPQLRAKGEATFLALRQSEGALDYAAFALEHSHDPLVLFQSFNAVLFVLPSLAAQQPSQGVASLSLLRDFLLHFCVSRSEQSSRSADAAASWPQYLRSRAYQTAIAVEKRLLGLELAQHVGQPSGANSGLDTVIQAHVGLLNTQLSSLLSLPSPWPVDAAESATALARIVTGLGLVRAVVDEFILTSANDVFDSCSSDRGRSQSAQSTSKPVVPGSAVGLNLLQHRQCKALIQNHVLAGLMTAVFQLLYNTISDDNASSSADSWRHTLFFQAVSATEKLLGWTFTRFDPFSSNAWQQQSRSQNEDSVLATGVDEDDEPSAASTSSSGKKTLSPQHVPDAFIPVLLSDDVVSLLSTAYRFGLRLQATASASRDISFSVHRLRQCILSTCSFTPQAQKPQHVPVLVSRTKHLCATLQSLVDEECASSSSILSARGNSMLFLAQAFQIIVSVVPLQILASSLQSGDHSAQGSFAFISSLSSLGKHIFGLAFHRPKDTDEEDDLAVLTEDTVDVLLACWQALVSSLRQQDTAHTQDTHIRVFAQTIHGSIRDQVFAPYVTGRLEAASIVSGEDDMSEVEEVAAKDRDTYSDQLITIANLARTSAADNLRALAQLAQPLCDKLTAKSQRQASFTDVEMGQTWEQIHWLILIAGHVLADDAQGETPEIPSEIASSGEPEDPAVALIMQLGMQLLQHLSAFGPASVEATSPQVTETLLWFTGRWTSSYLLIDERSGFATNAAIQRAFGDQAGRQVLTFLLQRLSENLQLWMSDSDVLQQLAQVLSAFTRSSGIMIHLLQLPQMEQLVSGIVSGLDHLPANTHGALIASVVSCIYSGATHSDAPTERSAEFYFKQITASIETRFGTLLSRADFSSISQRSDVISAVQTSLDMLEGLATSIQPNSAEIVYNFIAKFFPAFSQLVSVYDTRPEMGVSVLRVLHTLALSLELDFGAEPFVVMGLNTAVWSLMEALQGLGKKKTHLLLVSESGSPLDDDVPYEGLCLLVELLVELSGSARAGVDDGGSDQEPTLQPSKSSDVCLVGFEHVLSLLSAEPLNVPRLRKGVGRLTSSVFALFSGRLILLSSTNPALLNKAVEALSLCIRMDDNETAQLGLESIVALCKVVTHHFTPPPPQLVGALHGVLAAVLRLVLAEPLDSSLFWTCLFALSSLIKVSRGTELGQALSKAGEGVENRQAFDQAARELVESALSDRGQNDADWIHDSKIKLPRWRGLIRIR